MWYTRVYYERYDWLNIHYDEDEFEPKIVIITEDNRPFIDECGVIYLTFVKKF